MLNILADALLVATRFESPSAHNHFPPAIRPAKRSWAQIIGFKR